MEHTVQRTSAKIAMIVLLVSFSGCSMVRLSYDQGPRLVWWWLDGYVDFSREQKPQVKQVIQQWFGWHRSAQLSEYADLLSAVRSQFNDPLTPEQVCRWSDELQGII